MSYTAQLIGEMIADAREHDGVIALEFRRGDAYHRSQDDYEPMGFPSDWAGKATVFRDDDGHVAIVVVHIDADPQQAADALSLL